MKRKGLVPHASHLQSVRRKHVSHACKMLSCKAEGAWMRACVTCPRLSPAEKWKEFNTPATAVDEPWNIKPLAFQRGRRRRRRRRNSTLTTGSPQNIPLAPPSKTKSSRPAIFKGFRPGSSFGVYLNLDDGSRVSHSAGNQKDTSEKQKQRVYLRRWNGGAHVSWIAALNGHHDRTPATVDL